MANFVAPKLLGIDPERVYTAAEIAANGHKHTLGVEYLFDDGSTRRYVRAGAAIAQYDALTRDYAEGSHDYHPTTAVAQPVYAVSPVAIEDDGAGWVIVQGPATVKVEDGVAAGEYVVSTAVSGELDTRIEATTTDPTSTQMLALGASFAGTAPQVIAISTESTQDLATVVLR